ncbi:unnamed protein product [Psylliodes chrysocephalus]|uniref:RRM domain-containing protein n=1 Tax=Psylliodes chrysocephalus TaxID=3402493 RepID=A0A9P0CEY4_9CUCU|nr:unnamed protein product [Psylliodes chrysocephala]
MDYTVGSLADLISGQNTENKTKVKKIKIKTNEGKKKNLAVTEKVKNKNKEKLEENVQISKPKKRKIKDVSSKHIKKPKTDFNSLADSDDETSVNQTEINSNEQNEDVKIKKEKIVPTPEELARTIYVGNVPIDTQKKKMKQIFKKYGPIESVRFRGIPIANPKIPKKIAVIKKDFHPDRNSVYCYIRFINKEDAQEALVENGVLFQEHHLSVRPCSIKKETPDESKAIFIGNLIFNAEEEDLWKLFEPCGPISHIRIIRDTYSGMGKGFAYVNFKDSDGVQLALEMENVKLGNRELRIKPSSASSAKKNKNRPIEINANPQWRKKHHGKQNEHENGNQKGNPNPQWRKKPHNKQNNHENGSRRVGANPQWRNKQYNKQNEHENGNQTVNANPQWRKKQYNKQNEHENGNQTVNANPQWRKKHTKQNEHENDNTNEYKSKSEKPNYTQNQNFQGAKFSTKKKNKVNKGLLQKKKNVKKIAPISK